MRYFKYLILYNIGTSFAGINKPNNQTKLWDKLWEKPLVAHFYTFLPDAAEWRTALTLTSLSAEKTFGNFSSQCVFKKLEIKQGSIHHTVLCDWR